jgi:HK97 family phage major capsid protein
MTAESMNRRMRRDLAKKYGVRVVAPGSPRRGLARVSNRAAPPHGTASPMSPAEFEEFVSDMPRVGAALRDGTFVDHLRAYVTAQRTNADGNEVVTAAREEAERTALAWLRENGVTAEARRVNLTNGDGLMQVGVSRNRGADHTAWAPGAALDAEFADTTDFVRATWHRNGSVPEVAARLQRIRNDYSSLSPSDGGFLIPERLRAELLSVALESAIVRSRARVIPMDSLRVPFPVVDATSNASSVHGGIIAYWTAEGAALVESQAKFGRVVLEAAKLTARADVPNELLQDSIISLAAFIESAFPEALAYFEDVAFISGNGVGQPLGVLHAQNAGAIEVAKEGGQSADTIVVENLASMYARMLPTSLSNAVWLVPPDAFKELVTMGLSVGTGGGPIFMTNGIQGAPAMTIFGRPVIITEKVAKLGDAADVAFVDFRHYLIGDRMQMRADNSAHYQFGNDITTYRVIERVDGRPSILSAITPRNSGPTLSPYVKLAERA